MSEQTRRARTAQRLRDLRECLEQQTGVASLWEGSYRETIAERDTALLLRREAETDRDRWRDAYYATKRSWEDEARRAEPVARVAHAYVACLAEFTETAAGNLSDCCAEHLDGLIHAVDAWEAGRLDDAAPGVGLPGPTGPGTARPPEETA